MNTEQASIETIVKSVLLTAIFLFWLIAYLTGCPVIQKQGAKHQKPNPSNLTSYENSIESGATEHGIGIDHCDFSLYANTGLCDRHGTACQTRRYAIRKMDLGKLGSYHFGPAGSDRCPRCPSPLDPNGKRQQRAKDHSIMAGQADSKSKKGRG